MREAARPIHEPDRPARKDLKKRVRGARPIERSVKDGTDPQAGAIRGYCDAVRGAITDDGRPPLDGPGLVLHERATAVAVSLDRAAEKGGCRTSCSG